MILSFTDTHLTSDPKHRYRWDFFNDMLHAVSTKKYEAVFILGDLCDKKDKHPSVLVNDVVNILTEISKFAPLYILKGNHDHPDGGTPFWEFLGKINNIIYITKPSLFIISKVSYLFLPHSRNPKVEWEGISKYLPADFVLLHQTVKGARISSGMELEGADFDLSVFGGATVVSGDVHVPQVINGVFYIGSPYHIHYGDGYQGHYAIIGNKSIKRIPHKAPKLSVVGLTLNDDLNIVLDAHSGDYARLRFTLPMKDLDTWPTIKEGIVNTCNEKNVNIDSIEVVIQHTDIEDTHSEVMDDVINTLNPHHVFDEYVASEGIDSDKLVQFGRSILKSLGV
jgi:DNA repair exonuclease SbcCD nuclease subunit